jgi:beta-glucosidase
LPGSEGGGVADVLFRGSDRHVTHDFTGRLSFAWPSSPQSAPLRNAILFPVGYGLSYGSIPIAVPMARSRSPYK